MRLRGAAFEIARLSTKVGWDLFTRSSSLFFILIFDALANKVKYTVVTPSCY
jgi:hypothetical protein